MKRTHDDDDDPVQQQCRAIELTQREVKKSVSPQKSLARQQWAFFRSFEPYEKIRWVTAFVALRGTIDDPDSVRLILCLFLHVACLLTDDEGQPLEPLTARYYCKMESPRLFAYMKRNYIKQQQKKLRHERHRLLASGIPTCCHYTIVANDNPRDGLGTIFLYDSQIWDHRYREDYKSWIQLPAVRHFVCVDIRDTVTVRFYLSDKDCLPDAELRALQRRVDKQVVAHQLQQAALEDELAEGESGDDCEHTTSDDDEEEEEEEEEPDNSDTPGDEPDDSDLF